MTAKDKQYADLHAAAHAAGMAAGAAKVPVPMIVGSPSSASASVSLVVGSNGEKFDMAKPIYYVPSGVCGFAWIVIEEGRSGYARWLKKNVRNSHKNYYGGWAVWVNEFGQSMEQKEAYADAYAKVVKQAGIAASVGSRMD